MPFRSQHQWAWAFAAEQRGELPPGTAARWAGMSPPFATLPATAGAVPGIGAPGYNLFTFAGAAAPGSVPATAPPTAPTIEPRPEAPPHRRMRALALAGAVAGGFALALGFAAHWGRR